MEWVETTGNTIEEAKETALDELGVDEQDAEFEILEEPKTGLFGRVRAEGRVRARVRPTAPRPKEDRRERRKGRGKDSSAEPPAPAGTASDDLTGDQDSTEPTTASAGPRRNRNRRAAAADVAAALTDQPAVETGAGLTTDTLAEPRTEGRRSRSGGNRPRTGDDSRSGGRPRPPRSNDKAEEGPMVEMALDEQGQIAQEFLQGLLAQFGLAGEIAVDQPDEDNIELDIKGANLGMLIGPKGATLLSIQDLTRTVVQHKTGAGNGRINVDVGGYRRQRSLALANFARQVAGQVESSGERRALEAMSSADRKVVHDALTDVPGVDTLSEGEDPRRRVIILPAAG